MSRRTLVLGVASSFLALAESASAQHNVWRVDDSAAPGGDGKSWATAFQFLQDGLAAAAPGDEVRVAGGAQFPDEGGGETDNDRDASFELRDGIFVRGNYRGLASGGNGDDRDPSFITYLLGDIQQNDPTITDNAKNIVRVASGLCTLDGFTLQGGRFGNGRGAGATVGVNGLIAIDCTFRGNTAQFGGAVDCSGGSLQFERCSFDSNVANRSGGAVWIDHGTASFTDCGLSSNAAAATASGGAVAGEDAVLTFLRCVVLDNDARFGGAVALGRGVLQVADSRFELNFAGFTGAAIDVAAGTDPASSVTVERSRFIGNTGTVGGGALSLSAPTALVRDCHFQDNVVTTNAGGAMSVDVFCELQLLDSSFIHNRADLGGAALMFRGRIERCRFVDNDATLEGGAVLVGDLVPGETLEIIDCGFENNRAPFGAALVLNHATDPSSRLVLLGATVAGNVATLAEGAVHCEPAHANALTVRNSILHGNSVNGISDENAQLSGPAGAIAVDYSCIQGWSGARGGVGNTGSDPHFVDPSFWNYTLQPDSPCIEAGDPAFVPTAGHERDVEGNVRLTDAQLDRSPRLDMGAYEFGHVRLTTFAQPWPGGSVDLFTRGTSGMLTLLLIGGAPATTELTPLGWLFVDPASVSAVLPWPSAPSNVHFDIPKDLPPTWIVMQEFVAQGTAGNLSNAIVLDIH